MIRRPVGGKVVEVKANVELVTPKLCGFEDGSNMIKLVGFYIKNEDVKDIEVTINNGQPMLLKQGEMYDFRDLTYVCSCKVNVDSRVRFAGLI